MDSGKLLWATGVSQLGREKRPENVENDKQRETDAGKWRQSSKAKKAKKSSDDAATNGDPFAQFSEVMWFGPTT